MALSMKDAIDNIADVLNEAGGEYVAQIYNQICSDKVAYQGDSMFERIPEVSDELKDWAGDEGWSVMEAESPAIRSEPGFTSEAARMSAATT